MLPIRSLAQVRYKDPVFAQVTTASNVPYGSAKTHTGATQNLLMDIYQPQGDTASARPLFVWIHGGGYSGGSKTDGDIVGLCRYFAMRGYVTASPEYRLRSPLTNQADMGAQTIRALQDAKAAVRFLRARKADYRIDDSRILMGGTSAGGFISLQYAYLDADEVPAFIDTAAIGGIEGSGGNPGVSSAIRGIVNCWGGVGDSAWLTDGKLPALHFHGTNDQVVPYDIGYSLGNPQFTTFGSACVHRVLVRAGVRSELKLFPGMGHGVPGGDPRADTLLAMSTVFAYDVLFGNSTALRRLDSRRNGLSARPHRKAAFRADGRRVETPIAGRPGKSGSDFPANP